MFEAFRESDFRRFWFTQFISNMGSWMQAVAQGWLVYHITDSPFILGFVGFATSVPAVFLMLPGGVIADQLNRKRVVAVSQLVQAAGALFLALAILYQRINVWQIIAVALLVGVAQSFSAPAFQAMIVDLLEERGRLSNAIALNSLQFNTSRALGPLIAGATLSAWGSFWCFFLNALSFLPLVWVLLRVRNRQKSLPDERAMWTRLREGFRYVRNDRVVLFLLGVVAAGSLFGYPYLSLIPILARALFTDDAAGMGYLMGAIGVGALVAALALSIRTPRRALGFVAASLAFFGVALASVAALHSVAFVLILLLLCGGSMVLCFALCNTTIQQRVPDALRGRVLSMYTFAFFAFIPFGNLAAGMLAERRGIAAALLMLGGGVLFSTVFALAAMRAARR